MKAAVLYKLGDVPVYDNFPDPIPQNDEQLLIHVRAASVKNLDKLRASGKHYASHEQLPTVVGVDGAGVLEDGTRVYAQGISGMIAEKALVRKNYYVVLPDKIDDAIAASLPNAAIGAAMALLFRAKMRKGDTVLINGATGVTGQLAVQLARHYGAARVIATGRNPKALEKLKDLGADITISLNQQDETVIKEIKKLHGDTPVNSVIDYLWGRPVEQVISALKGGGMDHHTKLVKIVTVGSMAGETISLPSAVLRSSDIELLGSGIGSLSKEDMMNFGAKVLPEIFRLAAEGRLKMETEEMPLQDIGQAWHKEVAPGKRLVIRMN